MKNILLILTLAISLNSVGQNSYKIVKQIWNYTKPSDFISRIDNFEKAIKIGQEYVKNKKNELTLSTDDKILFSIAKNDSALMNIALASYKNNLNIKRFTLKGYAEKLGGFLKENQKKEHPKAIVTLKVQELTIDKKKFYLLSKTTTYSEQHYTYTSDFYVSEIQGKEFSITVVCDNETDREKIKKSILESTFE